VGNGDPGTADSVPPDETENTDTLFAPALAVARRAPFELNAMEAGAPPVANGEPGTGVKPGCAAAG
jgi:hypothetical protein